MVADGNVGKDGSPTGQVGGCFNHVVNTVRALESEMETTIGSCTESTTRSGTPSITFLASGGIYRGNAVVALIQKRFTVILRHAHFRPWNSERVHHGTIDQTLVG